MKTFSLPPSSSLKILKATPRKEHHGDDLVQAISLRLELGPAENDVLHLLDAGLQDMLFWTPPEVAAQCTLEGMPLVKKHRRCAAVHMPLKVAGEVTGYTCKIDHGIDDDSALELYACTLNKFEADASEGGSATIRWSLSSNREITPELVGMLCSLEGGEITATITPPVVAQVIDGTQAAFDADHPIEPDAGDLFAAQHGGDQHAGDFGRPDDDGADSEGGETDISAEAAEFEAGAAAAMAAAGMEPKGRRRGGLRVVAAD